MLYSNAHSTGAFSDAIGEMSATKIIDPEGAWSLGEVDGLESALTNPAAGAGAQGHHPSGSYDLGLEDKYLYLVGNGDTTGTYSAGKFVITIEGYAAPDDM